jgi:hypothetical protein
MGPFVFSLESVNTSPIDMKRLIADEGIYQGELDRNGSKFSMGIMVWNDGAKYSGYWLNNQPHGFGRFIYVEGD